MTAVFENMAMDHAFLIREDATEPVPLHRRRFDLPMAAARRPGVEPDAVERNRPK